MHSNKNMTWELLSLNEDWLSQDSVITCFLSFIRSMHTQLQPHYECTHKHALAYKSTKAHTYTK